MRSSSIVLSLLVFALLPLQDANFFISPVEEGRAVCPGEELIYTFNIFDNTSLDPTLVCSVLYSNGSSDKLTLPFYNLEELVKNQFLLQANGSDDDDDFYNFTLTVNASLELNGTVINCSQNSFEVGRATLLVVEADVRVSLNGTRAIATCSGFIGSAYCSVDYGTSPDSLKYSATSQQMGSAGESVTVELTEAGPNATYYYEANLSDCGKVKGQFTTGDYNVCTLADLGANASDSSACGGEKAGYIPNGMFCYTGLTPGSTATYSCDKDYELSGGNGELVCQDDGTWSGPTSTCEKNCRESDLFEGGNDTNPSLCHAGENALVIPGGALSCTGLTPGSTATVSCEDGYELSEGNGELVCQDDGTWDGTTSQCVPLVCSLDDLGALASDSSSGCGEGEMAASIPNGMLCYTGLTPGSTAANVTCDDGYEPNGTATMLVCLPSEKWSGVLQECIESAVSNVGVIVAVTLTILAAIVLVPCAAALAFYIVKKSEDRQPQPVDAELGEVHSQNSHGMGRIQLAFAKVRRVLPGISRKRSHTGTHPPPSPATNTAVKDSSDKQMMMEPMENPRGSGSEVEPSDKPCPEVGGSGTSVVIANTGL